MNVSFCCSCLVRSLRSRLQKAVFLRFVLVLMAFGVRAVPLHAQQRIGADTIRITLAAARRLAAETNPSLLAASLERAIAAGRLQQARTLKFNPSADLLVSAGGNGSEASLSQEIELFGQRGVRARSATAGLAVATGLVENTRRVAIGDVDRTFYRLVFRKQRAKLAETVLDLSQRLSAVAARQLSAGEISRLDYNLAVIETGRSRSRTLVARRERDELSLDFALLLGIGPSTVVDPVLDPSQHSPAVDSATTSIADARALVEAGRELKFDSLVAIALRVRPDAAATRARIEQAGLEVRLVNREALPNMIGRIVSEPGATSASRVIRGGFGMTLPIFNRSKGEAAARRASLEQAMLSFAALEARIKTDVAQAIAAYRAAAAEVEILETTVLPPARQNRQLLESAYREGKVGLPVLLLIRNQVVDAELDYWSAWLAEREALASLAELTGQNLSGLPGSEVQP